MKKYSGYKICFIKISAAFVFMLCAGFVCAQRLDIVSYVPVKSGIYDSLVTKNKTIFNSSVANNIFNLTVNSSVLKVEAGENIVFRNLLTPRLYINNSFLPTASEYIMQLKAPSDAGGSGLSFITMVSKSAITVLGGSAKQLNVTEARATDGDLATALIEVGLDTNVKFKIKLPDGCSSLGWKEVTAYPVQNYVKDDRTPQVYKVLGCVCSSIDGCSNPAI